MGSAIAHREKRVPVPNTPVNRKELADELRAYTKRLKVEEVLQGWGYALAWPLEMKRMHRPISWC
jgi:hypothetical protein